jgi:hypothetical protein
MLEKEAYTKPEDVKIEKSNKPTPALKISPTTKDIKSPIKPPNFLNTSKQSLEDLQLQKALKESLDYQKQQKPSFKTQ